MRVIGVLSWYSEKPSWLAACVSSMGRLCDHVVAFDGAYARFPTDQARSRPDEAETIARTADGLGMGWTIHSPREKWWGGEVEKRAAMLRAAANLAEPDDWILSLDADEVLADVWGGTRTVLSDATEDVGEVMITDENQGRAPIRRLFRALPELTVEQAHYVVTARKGSEKIVLVGDRKVHNEVPALPLHDVLIRHRQSERDPERKAQKQLYYTSAMPHEQEALAAV
ncbi:MAG TPA: hypothetical protein VNN79_17895 [Actinomycetota bacterium]|nr:hypothetical protein [Actinomycetota bacterium]